jgi:hypothetical protein
MNERHISIANKKLKDINIYQIKTYLRPLCDIIGIRGQIFN